MKAAGTAFARRLKLEALGIFVCLAAALGAIFSLSGGGQRVVVIGSLALGLAIGICSNRTSGSLRRLEAAAARLEQAELNEWPADGMPFVLYLRGFRAEDVHHVMGMGEFSERTTVDRRSEGALCDALRPYEVVALRNAQDAAQEGRVRWLDVRDRDWELAVRDLALRAVLIVLVAEKVGAGLDLEMRLVAADPRLGRKTLLLTSPEIAARLDDRPSDPALRTTVDATQACAYRGTIRGRYGEKLLLPTRLEAELYLAANVVRLNQVGRGEP